MTQMALALRRAERCHCYDQWLLLVIHPHVAPFEDIARIEVSAHKSGATGSDSVPYLVNMQRRLEEGLQALQGLEALTTQWRETSARELAVKINYVKTTIRVLSKKDETAITMKKGFERQEEGHAGSC